MSTLDTYDVVIVGAGPVGAAGANIAGRHGLRCLLVDESVDVFPLPRAIHFDADIMRIFQFADLVPRVEPITRATTGGVHLGADGEPIRVFRVPDRPGDLGWRPHYMFFQPEMDTLLREAAAERDTVDVRLGWRCEQVEQDADGAHVTLVGADGTREVVRSRYVIAADGAASTTRKALGVGLSDYDFDEPWVVVDVTVPDPALGPDHTIMYCDPKRPGTYVPGPAGNRRWEFLLLPGETGEEQTTPEGIRRLIGEVTSWVDPAELEIVRVAVYHFHGLVADRWQTGRVFLAGDAAHQTPPFYGQGMCHGIRDMRNLLWKMDAVVRQRAGAALLDTYQTEREPHVRAVIEAAISNGRYISTLDPAEAAARDEQLRARMGQGQDARSFRDIIPGLTAGLLDPEPQSPAVGLLFVQPRVGLPDGSEVLLDDLLGEGWALVTRPEVGVSEDAAAILDRRRIRLVTPGVRIVPVDDTLDLWFSTFACAAALVRPDRYVYGTARDAADLRGLLARFDGAVPAGEQDRQMVA